jgi:hypothetical protein
MLPRNEPMTVCTEGLQIRDIVVSVLVVAVMNIPMTLSAFKSTHFASTLKVQAMPKSSSIPSVPFTMGTASGFLAETFLYPAVPFEKDLFPRLPLETDLAGCMCIELLCDRGRFNSRICLNFSNPQRRRTGALFVQSAVDA